MNLFTENDAINTASEANSELIKLETIEGLVYASSLEVAQRFGKEHRHVLDSIRLLEKSGKLGMPNFRHTPYTQA